MHNSKCEQLLRFTWTVPSSSPCSLCATWKQVRLPCYHQIRRRRYLRRILHILFYQIALHMFFLLAIVQCSLQPYKKDTRDERFTAIIT